MAFFKFRDHFRCPSTMTVKSVSGIVLGEFCCRLGKNHDGPHRGENGLVWNNTGKLMENLEKMGEKPNRPMIFLGK